MGAAIQLTAGFWSTQPNRDLEAGVRAATLLPSTGRFIDLPSVHRKPTRPRPRASTVPGRCAGGMEETSQTGALRPGTSRGGVLLTARAPFAEPEARPGRVPGPANLLELPTITHFVIGGRSHHSPHGAGGLGDTWGPVPRGSPTCESGPRAFHVCHASPSSLYPRAEGQPSGLSAASMEGNP